MTQLQMILSSAKVFISEGSATEYDYNEEISGHDIRLFLPMEILEEIDINKQNGLINTLIDDIKRVAARTPGEFINSIHLEMNDENDPEFQAARLIGNKPLIQADSLKIWKPGFVRVFISHRDQQKAEAQNIALALEAYGFSCFVAHDTIEPMSEWRLEIMKGLETMEVMLVFLTDDLHESTWTNQEIGFALGAGKPVVCLKVGDKDPEGFIGHIQAMKAGMHESTNTAERLYPLLRDAVGAEGRLQTGLVKAFAESPDWGEARVRFDRLSAAIKKLTEQELQIIIDAYATNDQLHFAAYLTNNNHRRLINFLEKVTAKKFAVNQNKIEVLDAFDTNDIPF